ncbi:aryl-alcohol dehydrogenase-like predicted oxidoreductase [Clostridium beijerinckii]|nr:aryl-alcohol dehydrogenase-like predicted oxidoreductase [Clostridium beijerinckii]
MKNIDIGNSGIKASEIGLGCMRMASVEKERGGKDY